MEVFRKSFLITELIQKIKKDYRKEEQSNFTDYVTNLLTNVAEEELALQNIDILYAALQNNWRFISTCSNQNIASIYVKGNHSIIELLVEDKPFMVDSIQILLQNLSIQVLFIANTHKLKVSFDSNNKLISLSKPDGIAYVSIYIEVNSILTEEQITNIKNGILLTIDTVTKVVNDWKQITNKLSCINEQLIHTEDNSINNFTNWIKNNHFTFLGYAEFIINEEEHKLNIKYIENTGLGLLSNEYEEQFFTKTANLNQQSRHLYLSDLKLFFAKSTIKSIIHRSTYFDIISFKVKQADKTIKEFRFIGLYTAAAYSHNVMQIPYIKDKIDQIFKQLNYETTTHEGKKLLNILDTLPKDDIFSSQIDELQSLAVNIYSLREKPKIKLFIKEDILGNYYSCFIYIPRDVFDSNLRKNMQNIMLTELQGSSILFNVFFSESILVRVHFTIFSAHVAIANLDLKKIEEQLQSISITWQTKFNELILSDNSFETAYILPKYANAFPVSYMDYYPPNIALNDILYLEQLNEFDKLAIDLYEDIQTSHNVLMVKLYRYKKSFLLSQIVPIFENLGLQVLKERPFQINVTNNTEYWISEYELTTYNNLDLNIEQIKPLLLEAIDKTLENKNHNDGFNKLVLLCHMPIQEINILRAYSKYLWQASLPFSKELIEDAFTHNPYFATKIIEFFRFKFDPKLKQSLSDRTLIIDEINTKINTELEKVTNITHDKIIRAYLDVLNASLRTNFYQTTNNLPKEYLSIKIDSSKLPLLPKPIPYREIFVYSIDCEAIHLRGGPISRGGLRWSDRIDDFRTEVLGLMKAQQVKNAVIVPAGAKGGFVIKTDLNTLSKEDKQSKVINCYKTFIRGILDITDNQDSKGIIKPTDCITWDLDDPYLVVAADKGTATFSDIANSISTEYNFWLGDALASGGSKGYDHKKMSITALGAFESVKLHFKTLGIDVLNQPVTVIGIGDMAGDVFGNGLLLSKHYKLIAAFNHMHIFLDPNPDEAISYLERKRLATLPYSTWEDYDHSKISLGGGVYKRSLKQISITNEIKKLLDINEDSLEPNELIKKILTAKADLFWNGGIGTFVKASTETNHQVGDRTNDAIRINGNELNVTVVAEGGNLGFTQLARVEYALNGGLLNTDALDNSAGVNCSDVEVNIKILFQLLLNNKKITLEERDALLSEMQSNVAKLVINNNLSQNEVITNAALFASKSLNMHYKLLLDLEKNVNLDRSVEFLPAYENIVERKQYEQGFTRPELCILLAYTKIYVKNIILDSIIPIQKYCDPFLINYFPQQMQEKYLNPILSHPLRNQIIASQISNKMVSEMGITFVNRILDETGAKRSEIIRAWLVAINVFDSDNIRTKITELSNTITPTLRIAIDNNFNRILRKATRWILRHNFETIDVTKDSNLYSKKIQNLWDNIPNLINNKQSVEFEKLKSDYIAQQIAPDFSVKLASKTYMFGALDIVNAHIEHKLNLSLIGQTYFNIGAVLKLDFLRETIFAQEVKSNWDALARAAFMDDLDKQQIDLTILFLKNLHNDSNTIETTVTKWYKVNYNLFKRWIGMLDDIKASSTEFTMVAVALRELQNLSGLIKISL